MTSIHTLHILNKAPEHPRTAECMNAIRSGDALLLTENAVLALSILDDQAPMAQVYAIASDAIARGFGQSGTKATLVDYPAMVKLTAQAQHLISW
ncbi:MAG: sulfurtransferase complex subunit TusB [Marinobacter sp.]|nr:sulfurtransferase complex subunit TusB [Marinobacter sp.]